MFHNPEPLSNFQKALINLRTHFLKLVPENQLETASGVKRPYLLHNFMKMKISFFINPNDPNRKDLVVQAAKKAVPKMKSIPTTVLAAVTVKDFIEALVNPSFELCCAAVYDSNDKKGVLKLALSAISQAELALIEQVFKGVLTLEEWTDQGKLWSPADARTVKVAISEGTN